jgi:hypothetical protein
MRLRPRATGTAGGSFNSAFVGKPPCCYVPLLFSVRCLSLARHRHRSQRGAKHSEHEKSYTRAPMRARSMAPRIESGAAATQNVKPFTIEEQRWFNQANGSRW